MVRQSGGSGGEVSLFDRTRGVGGEGTVWDDSELIAAWNAQLQRIHTEKAQLVTIPLNNESSSSSSDDGSNEEEEEAAVSDAESGQQKAMSLNGDVPRRPLSDVVVTNKRPREEDVAGDAWVPPVPPGVDRQVASMLRAWFLAGFETGRYAASER